MTARAKSFPDHEWAFHRIAEGERAAAWTWELHREAGSGGKPWLKLTKAQKQKVCDYIGRSFTIQETDLAAAALGLKVCNGTGEAIHILRINWQVGIPQVQAALASWAEKTAAQQSLVGSHRPKKKQNQFSAYLGDLAIFRADARGIKGKEAADRLWRLLQNSKSTPSHLRAACRRTAERIKELAHPFRITAVFPEMKLR
jgi:hypothetical protein